MHVHVTNLSTRSLLQVCLVSLTLAACDGGSDIANNADAERTRAAAHERKADSLLGIAANAIAAAERAIAAAEAGGNELALTDSTKKRTAAANATKKLENANRKAAKAKQQAEKAKNDNSQEDLDNAKENNDKATELLDDAAEILGDLGEIAKARKTLRDLGFSDVQIDDILNDLNGATVTETGQPGVDYRRFAGDQLRDLGVDITGPDGQAKIDRAAKALEDLFHGEGQVGDGADAPYPD